MKLKCNKSLRLYLRTQYNSNIGTKLGKGKKKKFEKIYGRGNNDNYHS